MANAQVEYLLKINFLLKVLNIMLVIAIIFLLVIAIKSINDYNLQSKETSEEIKQKNYTIKELEIQLRDLGTEYNQLLQDNEENKKQIEWLNDQLVLLRS